MLIQVPFTKVESFIKDASIWVGGDIYVRHVVGSDEVFSHCY